ncbi:N-acetyltransferase family protein [Kiloniella sp.]|uniref:GNAT family N-acetyltransferase n=1 Tax=Kiloniella sp. TaxID=1938587 RepID=UPI003B02D591
MTNVQDFVLEMAVINEKPVVMTSTKKDIQIREVSDKDMLRIHEIYADEVLCGVSSWEEVPPTVEELVQRRDAVLAGGFPYRVALKGGEVMGYSYASSYRPRPGYRYTVENSIYVHRDARGLGIGRLLLEDLIVECETRGYRQMIAVIGDSENKPSIDFHEHMGFSQAGIIRSIGFKFGRWMDSVIMQRPLNEGSSTLPE